MSENLPVKQTDDFFAPIEVMDLSPLKDQMFLVAVSQGDRNKGRFLSTTTHGPYNYLEMIEEVGIMWQQEQHHAKVVICEKDRSKPIKTLDQNTIDYIEEHYENLLMEGFLEGAFDDKKEYTCKVGISEADIDDDPRHLAKQEKVTQDAIEQDQLP
jgi:hypothetical protein